MNLLRQSLLIGMLFVLALLIAGLLILVHRAVLVSPWWQLAEIGIILIVYGLVELSIRINMPSFLHSIRSPSKVGMEPSLARITHASTLSTLEVIDEISSPVSALHLVAPNGFDVTDDPQIYLHKDFLYSQN